MSADCVLNFTIQKIGRKFKPSFPFEYEKILKYFLDCFKNSSEVHSIISSNSCVDSLNVLYSITLQDEKSVLSERLTDVLKAPLKAALLC